MGKRDRKTGVPETMTSIPLVDPHAMPDNPSIGDLVKDATAQVSTLVRAEVELAKAEITRDVKKGLTGSVFFIIALVVLLYSTFFMFFFLAELLSTWLWRWAAFLIVFILMLVVTAVFAFLGYRKVRRIRGPQQTIESVKETTAALTPGLAKFAGSPPAATATPALDRPTPAPERVPSPPRTSARTTPVAVPATAAAPVYQPEPELSEPVYQHPEPEPATTEYTTTEYTATEYTAIEYATAAYDEPAPTDDDPTAAIYADSRRPVTRDDDPLPGDPSGW